MFENPLLRGPCPANENWVKSATTDNKLSQLNNKLLNLFSFFEKLSERTSSQHPLKQLVKKCQENGIEYLLKAEQLDLSQFNLKQIPEEVGCMASLKELTLIDNQLSDLPESLLDLSHLRKVELEGNLFKTLPQVVHKIALDRIQAKKYFELYLRENPMKIVPENIEDVVKTMPRFDSIFR